MSFVRYTKPSITEKEIQYAVDAAKNGWGEECYKYILRFEELFRSFVEAEFSIATSSCTGALHMGLAALDIGPGDEVILADTNWIATAAPITYLGATPVFVDILPDTWCLDPVAAEEAITQKTKAIIAVHLYGNVCEMDKLLDISERFGIPIIEDAAEGIGSCWNGNHVGTLGAFGTFSFHGTKTITTGEGGMFITNDKELFDKVYTLSNHGRSRRQKKQFWPDVVGYKYKLSNIQAAVGCGQIERISELISRKREIFHHYAKHLVPIGGIAMNPEKSGTTNGFWMPTAVFDPKTGITREKILEAFKEEMIDGRVFFWPLSSLPMFESNYANTNSYDIAARAINLPSYHDMTSEDQDRVIKTIKRLL